MLVISHSHTHTHTHTNNGYRHEIILKQSHRQNAQHTVASHWNNKHLVNYSGWERVSTILNVMKS